MSQENKKRIVELGRTDPVIHGCLVAHEQHNGCTYVEALEQMVLGLHSSLTAASAQLLKLHQQGLPPMVIVTSEEDAQRIQKLHGFAKGIPYQLGVAQ